MLFFIVLAAWFTFDGYRNGIYYGLVRLATLVAIYAFAPAIGQACSPYFEGFDAIPAVIRPYFSVLVVGVVMLFVGYGLSHIVRAKTMKLAKDATPEEKAAVRKARLWGMAMGAVVGVVLALVLYVIFWNIGWVAEEMHLRQAADTEMEEGETDVARIADPLARKVIEVKQAIEASPLGPVVIKANPVEVEDYELVRGILSIVNDPIMLEEFRRHPNVQPIMKNEKVLALLKDEEIRKLVLNRDYRGLLRNEKLAALVNDKQIVEQVKAANPRQVLEDIKKKRQAGAKEDPGEE
jgi:uncharacterized membrane protein YvlD (DUF360 family)